MYCHRACGVDDWVDTELGCQQSEANAFCKLKLCDENSYAISYKVTFATQVPGFSCDTKGTNFGDWLGFTDVYFTNNVRRTNGHGKVVSNVICETAGYIGSTLIKTFENLMILQQINLNCFPLVTSTTETTDDQILLEEAQQKIGDLIQMNEEFQEELEDLESDVAVLAGA